MNKNINKSTIQDGTRGGQVELHNLMMFLQVLKETYILSLIPCIFITIFLIIYKISYIDFIIASKYLYIKTFSTLMSKKILYSTKVVIPGIGKRLISIPAHAFISNKIYYYTYTRTINLLFLYIKYMSLASIILTTIVYRFVWIKKGRKLKNKKVKEGNEFVEPKKLNKIINPNLKKYEFKDHMKIGDLILPKESEFKHTIVFGTTGSGKTTCFLEYIKQIRARGDKIVIIDSSCNFISKIYREDKDIILNPLDQRSALWTPWAEENNKETYKNISAGLIPTSRYTDPFWVTAARTVFTAAIDKLNKKGERSIKKLHELLCMDDDTFIKFFENTDAAGIINKNSDKTGGSIRATLTTYIENFLNFLEDTDNPFSIIDWVNKDDDSNLFIACTLIHRESLVSLMSLWFDMAIKYSVIREHKRPIWFIVDELKSLNELKSLPMLVEEGRKYHLAGLFAAQNIAQIREVYSHEQAQNILANCNTKIFFKNSSNEINKWISETLGMQKVENYNENLSYGSNSIRDGVSLQLKENKELLFESYDIENLPNLEALVKVPTGKYVTKIKLNSSSFISDSITPFIKKNVIVKVKEDKQEKNLDNISVPELAIPKSKKSKKSELEELKEEVSEQT
ncbi:MAG: type IV secretion system DNA-binding domain-containing protein [Sphingobacteriia bacterium]|nr:type IV secretion system DNA-binding domain-containing protein [Sphingobacteriia bacterium]